MPFLTKIISGGPGLLIAFALCLIAIKAMLINLAKPYPSICSLFFRRCIFLLLQYSANSIEKRQFLNSPAGPSLPSAFYSSGDLPVVKSNRPDVSAFLSGSAKKAGFLLGIFVLLSFANASAATITSTRAGGNWNDPATWVGGAVPSTGDDVTITSGATVVIDSDAVVGTLTVSGILQYDSSSAYSLTATEFITVNAEGVFRSAQAGAIKNHRLIAHGSIINNGTIDFSSNTNEAGVELVFTGPGNAIFNCSDAIRTNLRQENGITLNKGKSATSVLSFIPGKVFQVLSDGSSNAKGFLTIENGTFNVIGSRNFRNPVFNADGTYTIPATGGFWLGNLNAEITGMNGDIIIQGELKITNGIFNAGTSAGNSLKTEGNGNLKISGGVVNVAGKLTADGGVCSISEGTLNLAMQPNSANNEPALRVSSKAKLEIFGNPLITITYPNSGQQLANDIQIQEGSGSKFISGGAIQLGTEATPAQSFFLVSGERIIPYLTAFSECSTVAYNTSKVDVATIEVSALPRIALDKTAPEITAPEKITIKCGETPPSAYASLSEFTKAGGVVSDNCAVNPFGFKLVKEVRSKAICPYIITRTYEIADASGNTTTTEQKIYVEGNIAEPQAEPIAEQPIAQELKLKSAMASFTAVKNGDWNDPATWGGTGTPSSTDDVSTATFTVTVNAASFCKDITIDAGGTLNYSGTNTLTVSGNLLNIGTISSVGVTGKILLYGNWTNNGTYNGGTNGIVEFTGTSNATINGSTNFEELTITKGSLNTALTITGNTSVTSGGSLLMNSGLIKIPTGGSFTVNPASALSIPAIAGFDIVGGILSTGNFTISNRGLMRISSGTANFGTNSGNSIETLVDGVFQVSGTSVVNIAGRLENSAGGTLAPLSIPSGINISGGTVTLATKGNGLDNVGTLNVTTNGAFNFTGGTIVFQSESTAGPAIDLGLVSGTGNGAKTTVGGTFQFGNALTPPNTIFNVSSSVPLNNVTSAPNADLKLINDVTIGNWALDTSTTIDLNGKKIQLAVSTSGTNYTFPIANGSNLAKLVLNFSGITSAGTVTIASSGVLPSGFLLNPGTLTTPIYITNNTVVYSTVSGSYQLPSGFTALQKVGFYNGSWSYQPAAASVSFSGWNNITGSAFALADCTAPTITGTLNVCAGLTTQLTGSDSPAASSPWISGTPSVAVVDNSGLVTGVSAGTSLITYTNNAGCQQTVTVTVNPLPTISGTLNVCVGSTTNLTGSGTPAVTTPWASSNAGVATVNSTGVVTGSSAGTSVITYTNTNGCTITATITVNPLPVPTVTGPKSACAGSTGNIYFTEPGMGTYTWTASAGGNITAGAGTNSITVTWNTDGPQIVTVSYTNINGCAAASPKIYDVTVNPKPTVVITNPAAVCSPSTVDLTASAVTSGSTAGLGYTYFTDVNGTITLTNPSTVSVTGTYYIKGTTASGCSDIKAVTVTIHPAPTVVVTNPAAVCSPATVNLAASGVTAGSTASLTYSYWTNAGATVPLANYTTVGVTGTYYIKGTTAAGCYDIKPVSVVVNQTPVGTNTSTTICSGGNPNINLAALVSVPSTFTWVVGSVTGSVSNTTSGSGSTLSQMLTGSGTGGTVVYRVTPISTLTGNCIGSVFSVTVTVNTLPSVTLQPESLVVACENSFVSFTAAAIGSPNPTVQWQISATTTGPWTDLVDGGNINGATTNALLYNIPSKAPSPRYYRAVYTNSCGSTASDYLTLVSDKGPQLNTDMPGTINGCAGGTITFTAKVTGAGAGNDSDKRIDGIIQYLDGSTWVDIPSSAKSDNSGTLDYSFSLAISDYPYGTTFRIAFNGKCGSVSTSTRVIYPTSVVTAPNGCVGTPITLSHDGSPLGTWRIINSSGTIVYTLPNAPGQTLSYTPTAAGCYTAQYSTGSCNDAKQFVVFPALPSVPFVTSGCGNPVSLSSITDYSGFTAEYAVQPPSGVMSSWGTFAQAQALLSNTAGCWTLKARYVSTADCGTTLAGSTTTATGCTEAIFNAFVFPEKPVLTAPFNTCASAFTLPSVPAISGFTVEYSIDNGTFAANPTIPTTPGCHTVKARYVVATACGTVAAGATGGVACESDPVSVVIFPAAPPAPTVSAGCGAFTVTPPTSIAGFNIEYSFDNGSTWSVSNASPVGENCAGYTVVTRYVLASDCGTTVAGTTGAVAACSSSPSVIRKVDTTPPVVTCNTLAPAPVCPNTGSAYVHSGTSWDASVSDNCAAPTAYASLSGATTATNLSTLNNVSFNIGITTVTWTASDGCNTSTCSFSVTVNPKPVINSITAPDLCSGGTFTVTPINGTNGTVPAGTTYSWVAPSVAGITGATSGTNSNTISGTLNNTTAAPIIVIYTVTPTSGAGCVGPDFTVTVTVNPILTCSITGTSGPVCPNSTGNTFSSAAGMSNYTWSIAGNGTISAGGNTQTVTVTAGSACNAPFLLTLNYNDASGCSSSCTVSVNVVDNTRPAITCQGGVTTNTNSGQCIAAPVVLVPPTVSDGCTGSITITNDAPAQYPIGVTIVTWTATDACGNWATCAQTVTVVDNQPGTLTCIPSFQWPADDNELFATNVPIPQPSYTYSDNCGTYTLTWTLSGATTSNSVSTGINEIPSVYPRLNVGDNIFAYTVTDAGNNSVGCTFTVTVYSFPEIVCAPGILTDTSTNSCTNTFDPGVPDLIQGQPDITWTWTIDNPLSADGSGTTVTTVPFQSPPSIGKIIFDHGTTTITWTATNKAGTATCTQIITVNDVTQPVYTPSPQPIEVCVENIISATYSSTSADVAVVNPDPDYYLFRTGTDTSTLDLDLISYLKDNCCPDIGTMTWTITFSAVPGNPATPGTIGPEYGQPSKYPTDIKLWGDGVTYQPVTHKISYTVYDCHGNHSSFSRDITISPRPELTKMP